MRTKFENKSYDPTGDYWFNLISLFIFLYAVFLVWDLFSLIGFWMSEFCGC